MIAVPNTNGSLFATRRGYGKSTFRMINGEMFGQTVVTGVRLGVNPSRRDGVLAGVVIDEICCRA